MVLAIFGTINGFELLVVVAAALMVFGSRLPDVALRGVAHFMRARRALTKMWRDTGLEDELRRVRRDIEMSIPRAADFDVDPGPPPPAAAIDPYDESEDPDDARAHEYYDSSVDIQPADGIIASGEWDADEDVDRREPSPDDGAGSSPGDAVGHETVTDSERETSVDAPLGEAASEGVAGLEEAPPMETGDTPGAPPRRPG